MSGKNLKGVEMEQMIYLHKMEEFFAKSPFRPWVHGLREELQELFLKKHGDSGRWEEALFSIPEIEGLTVDLSDGVTLSGEVNHEVLEAALRGLMPWRKGPFQIADLHIDTEWRSDFKWARVAPHLSLKGKNILDVGCGNGYYGWRMLGAGAKSVIGIDPNWLFLYQFLAFRNFMPEAPIWQLPIPLEALPEELELFDVTFSMGVFYHRRSPIDHLYQLKGTLKRGGELVLETLVVDGDESTVLMPKDRYAQMRNVWYLPSVAALKLWLERVGFINVRAVDLSVTSLDEQRTTSWMEYLSLADFLDPNDRSLTIEGYPAPQRVVMIAEKP